MSKLMIHTNMDLFYNERKSIVDIANKSAKPTDFLQKIACQSTTTLLYKQKNVTVDTAKKVSLNKDFFAEKWKENMSAKVISY